MYIPMNLNFIILIYRTYQWLLYCQVFFWELISLISLQAVVFNRAKCGGL
jgi:hypothetical protein